MRFFVRLEDLALRASARLDRHPLIALAVVGLLVVMTTVSMAAAKPLWHDEIFTVLLARLGAADLWTANLSGVDLSPPLNTLLTHVALSAGGTDPVVIRLAPLAGFALAVALIFEFVRRRSNTVTAVSAALLCCFTAGYRYSYEARGYGLMMGFAALSVFAWAEAAAGRRRWLHVPLLAIGLAASYWTHFYGVFAAAPVIAGELARTLRRRKIDARRVGGAWSFISLVDSADAADHGRSVAGAHFLGPGHDQRNTPDLRVPPEFTGGTKVSRGYFRPDPRSDRAPDVCSGTPGPTPWRRTLRLPSCPVTNLRLWPSVSRCRPSRSSSPCRPRAYSSRDTRWLRYPRCASPSHSHCAVSYKQP